jgi:hypothetical protein
MNECIGQKKRTVWYRNNVQQTEGPEISLADHCVIIFHSEASLSPVYERPFSPFSAERYTVRYQQGQSVSGKPDGLFGVHWEETVGNRDIDRFQRPALTHPA